MGAQRMRSSTASRSGLEQDNDCVLLLRARLRRGGTWNLEIDCRWLASAETLRWWRRRWTVKSRGHELGQDAIRGGVAAPADPLRTNI